MSAARRARKNGNGRLRPPGDGSERGLLAKRDARIGSRLTGRTSSHSRRRIHAYRNTRRDGRGRDARRGDPRHGEEVPRSGGERRRGRRRRHRVGHCRTRVRGRRRDHRQVDRRASSRTPTSSSRCAARPSASSRTKPRARSSSPSWTRTATRRRSAQIAAAGISAFAMELMPRITRAQVMDVLSSQANLAGYRAVIDAAAEFGRALPMMMTAAGTVPAAKVFVMGAGVAGLQAIATARRLGGGGDRDRRAAGREGAGRIARAPSSSPSRTRSSSRPRPPPATPSRCRRSTRPSRPRSSPSTSRSRTSSSPRR